MTTAGNSSVSATQLDVVFDGTWVIVPSVDGSNRILGVDVYSPACGHPQGVAFTNALNPNPWPSPAAFYMLDSHGHTISIQRSSGAQAGMPISGIDTSINHCIKKARPLSSQWDLLVSIPCGPDAWTSSDTVDPVTTDTHGNTVRCLSGKDAPAGKVSAMQTLSFRGVTAVELCGAPVSVQNLLPCPWNNSGSLIFEDEIPYIPTLQHERLAIFAMANLAGLDMALDHPLPSSHKAQPPSSVLRPMNRTTGYCGFSLIAMP